MYVYFFGLFCFSKTGTHFVGLASLELAMYTNWPEICYVKHTRVALNLEIHLPHLPGARITGMHHHAKARSLIFFFIQPVSNN